MQTVFDYQEILHTVFKRNVEKQTSWGKEQLKMMFMETLIEANNIMLRQWYEKQKGGLKPAGEETFQGNDNPNNKT